MNNSRASETCAFAKTATVGKLGFRGGDLYPERIVTEKDINSLIHNGNKLPTQIKNLLLEHMPPIFANYSNRYLRIAKNFIIHFISQIRMATLTREKIFRNNFGRH